MVVVPTLSIDADKKPIAARLLSSMRITKRPHPAGDHLAPTWEHIQAFQVAVSNVLKDGYAEFAPKMTLQTAGLGETYEITDDGKIRIRQRNGAIRYHVNYDTLLAEPICIHTNDQGSDIFTSHVETLIDSYRCILFVDDNHQESRDLINTDNYAGLREHKEKIMFLASAKWKPKANPGAWGKMMLHAFENIEDRLFEQGSTAWDLFNEAIPALAQETNIIGDPHLPHNLVIMERHIRQYAERKIGARDGKRWMSGEDAGQMVQLLSMGG